MKTAELTGALLDYWVARAEGVPAGELYFYCTPYTKEKVCARASITTTRALHYSTDWAQGGPLLARGGHSWEGLIDECGFWVCATFTHGEVDNWYSEGDTPLQAICRAVVRAAFGDEVDEVAGC